jgi:O-antigen ligase
MNSDKMLRAAGIVVGAMVALYLVYANIGNFSNISFLGGILFLEILAFCLWKYDRFFFPFVMLVFIWAGTAVPMQSAGTQGRWVVLAAGAVVGYIIWMKTPRRHFALLHLVALFCVLAAFVSASVSPFPRMAFLKALSLLLLFLYCSAGARVSLWDRTERFFPGLLLVCELATYGTAFSYFVAGLKFWGNPNSLGAVASIALFPVLLWGWLTSSGPLRVRRLVALAVCTYLVFFSMARAGMASIILVTLVFCVSLRQYKLLLKVAAMFLCAVAIAGLLVPETLSRTSGDLKDAALYKGHKEEGMFGSRRSPWEETIATIKQRPLFGTGYGTSPNGEDPGEQFGRFASSAETAREHGSSYLTITEWVGLLGVGPFYWILILTAWHVARVFVWMRKTSNAHHYAVPLAMILLSGMVHASFEDWLFAVGSYPCVFFWVSAFLLADVLPATAAAPVPRAVFRAVRPVASNLGAVAPGK